MAEIPSADDVGRGPRGVAHEIAVQPPLPCGHRQVVVRQREMVHADRDVAGREERLDRGADQLHL